MNKYETLQEEINDICFKLNSLEKNWNLLELCPVCNSKAISNFFEKNRMNHDKCDKCNFIFLNPVPKENVLFQLYEGEFMSSIREYIDFPKALKNRDDASTSMPKDCYYKIIVFLQNKINQGKWLDVGGGIGTFSKMIYDHNKNYELFLNELNTASANFAKQKLFLNVIEKSANEIYLQNLKFDIITSNAVLEHVPEPLKFLEDYAKIINNGGFFFINVPNYTYLNRVFSKSKSYNVIPPFHVNFFNKTNLVKLFSNIDCFSEIEVWESGNSAFKLSDLLINFDNQEDIIPKKETDSIKVRYKLKRSFLNFFLHKLLSLIDVIINPIISRLDGRVYLNIVAKVNNKEL